MLSPDTIGMTCTHRRKSGRVTTPGQYTSTTQNFRQLGPQFSHVLSVLADIWMLLFPAVSCLSTGSYQGEHSIATSIFGGIYSH